MPEGRKEGRKERRKEGRKVITDGRNKGREVVMGGTE
jgi:hypothetical protein